MTERTYKFLSKIYFPKWLKLILIPTLSLDVADLVITEVENSPHSSILASKKGYERVAGFIYIDPNITHFVISVYNKEKLLKDWKPIILRKMSEKKKLRKIVFIRINYLYI